MNSTGVKSGGSQDSDRRARRTKRSIRFSDPEWRQVETAAAERGDHTLRLRPQHRAGYRHRRVAGRIRRALACDGGALQAHSSRRLHPFDAQARRIGPGGTCRRDGRGRAVRRARRRTSCSRPGRTGRRSDGDPLPCTPGQGDCPDEIHVRALDFSAVAAVMNTASTIWSGYLLSLASRNGGARRVRTCMSAPVSRSRALRAVEPASARPCSPASFAHPLEDLLKQTVAVHDPADRPPAVVRQWRRA